MTLGEVGLWLPKPLYVTVQMNNYPHHLDVYKSKFFFFFYSTLDITEDHANGVILTLGY